MDDTTQAFDPNKTAAAQPIDPGRTQAMQPQGERTTSWEQPRTLEAAIVPGRSATMANGPAREQFLLELSSPTGKTLPGVSTGGQRAPLNLCLVVDRSGSMEGQPLQYAKEACSYVVELLGPDDVLSIVAFDEIVDVLMQPQRVTDKHSIKAGIAQLQPGYTTNLSGGIEQGAQQLRLSIESNRVTRMLVLSDGDPTAGIKDFPSLVNMAGDLKAQGITITLLGFGADYNEELLAGMAKRSGGNYYYIPQPQLLPEVFRSELTQLMSVSATNLNLRLTTARWVELQGVSGQDVVAGSESVTLDLPDLERGSTLQTVIDLEFPNHPLGHYRVASAVLEYDDTSGGGRGSIDLDFVMEFTADQARYTAPVDSRVQGAREVSQASRAVEKTMMGLKAGQLDATQAISDLERTQAILVQEGRQQEAQEVTQALRALKSGDTGGAEKTLMGAVVKLDQGKR